MGAITESVFAICICMYTMSHAMKILPIGITYATWSGVGIVALSLIGIFKYKQIPNLSNRNRFSCSSLLV